VRVKTVCPLRPGLITEPDRSRQREGDGTARYDGLSARFHVLHRVVPVPRWNRLSKLESSDRTRAVAARSPVDKTEPLLSGFAWQSFELLSDSATLAQLVDEHGELHVVGTRSYANHDIECRKVSEDARSHNFAKLAFESVSLDRRAPKLGHNEPNPRMRQRGSKNPDLQMLGPKTLPLCRGSLNVSAPCNPLAARESKPVRRLRTSSEA
jgi:hypothetical protein